MDNQKCWRETSWQSPFSCLASITSWAPQNSPGLFTIHHSLSEKLKKGGKKRRNFRWSHVKRNSCAAHFRMEQAHLFSCWLPALKSPEDRSTVRTHGPLRVFLITGIHSWRLSLSSSLTKNDKHISLFTTRFASFVKYGRISDFRTRHKLQGDFWSLQTATYEWIQMESCGEGIMY